MDKMSFIIVIVLGVILAAILAGGITGFFSFGSNETADSYDNAKSNVSYGNCVNDCRIQYPADRQQFQQCKATC